MLLLLSEMLLLCTVVAAAAVRWCYAKWGVADVSLRLISFLM